MKITCLKLNPLKMITSRRLFLLTLGMILLNSSCKKEPDDNKDPDPVIAPVSSAIYVLNEGLYGANNSSVTLYDLKSQLVVGDYFKTQNERQLGDVGSDFLIYGKKAYIVTNVSSQLEIVDAVTLKSIKQLSFFKNEVPQQPKSVVAYEGHVYVCSYDGLVSVIDTATMEIIKEIPVGANPDAILAAHGKIWVSNSGGLNFPDYDKTVSVIDPTSLTETAKIDVGLNPYTLQADNYGDIYVITRGNYTDEKMRLKIIDATTQQQTHVFEDFEAMNLTIHGDTAYVYHYDFGTFTSSILMLNVKTEEIVRSEFITDGTTIQTVYAIAVDPTTGDVYIGDGKNYSEDGKVYCFGSNGKLKHSFDVGINPVAIRFLLK